MGEMHYLAIDISDLQAKIDVLKSGLTRERADRALHDVCVDTAKSVKTIVGRAVPMEYDVKQSWVKAGIGHWEEGGGLQTSVVIPLSGVRGVIGGTFKKKGKRGRPKKGRRYKLGAKILKGKWSTLPETMSHQGGQPPFVGNGIILTRKYKGRAYPVVRVVGLGMPQMPLNQSKEEVMKQIHDKMSERLDHHIDRFFGGKA